MRNLKNQNCNMRHLTTFLFLIFSCLSAIANDNKTSLTAKAELGNVSAQYDLACLYINDETNYIKALYWLRKASKQGNQEATELIKDLIKDGYNSWGDIEMTPQYDLGILSDEDELVVKQHITIGCGNPDCSGHKEKILYLAHSYYHKKKYDLAIYYYKQALSLMRTTNLGWIDDENKADFTTACMDAYSMLGYCYEHGLGVQKSLQKAVDYYSLGGLYLTDKTYDASGIRQILRECNNSDLYKECGYFQEPNEISWGNGIYDGLVPSPFATRAWDKTSILFLKMQKYNYAKELLLIDDIDTAPIHHVGCIRALWIAEMYYKGLGTSIDYSKAYNIFCRITKENAGAWETPTYEYYPDIYADACYRLYECFTYGRGVVKNSEKARKYFEEALRFGSTSAIYDNQRKYELSLQ